MTIPAAALIVTIVVMNRWAMSLSFIASNQSLRTTAEGLPKRARTRA